MSETTYISPRMLVRDLLRRQPRADSVLRRLGVDPGFGHLSIELAAEASHRDPSRVVAGLRSQLRQTT